MSGTPPPLDMKAILTDRSNRVVVCCGAGGVGKTTTAAAMALRAAEYGRSVVVLTIDPAKRLAQALGIKELGNEPQRVQLGDGATGELHAMMLDMRRTFDEMVIEHSGPERAQAILDNQFYQTVATSLAGTQEYMAMEKLGQLLSQDRWDLVVVDTPPSRSADSSATALTFATVTTFCASAVATKSSAVLAKSSRNVPVLRSSTRCTSARA